MDEHLFDFVTKTYRPFLNSEFYSEKSKRKHGLLTPAAT